MSTISRKFIGQQAQLQSSRSASSLFRESDIWQNLSLPASQHSDHQESVARHGQRVGIVARRLAERLGFDPVFQQRAQLGGSLHDVGKLSIPDAILSKPTMLTREEVDLLRKHPASGARMIQEIEEMREVVPAIIGHHERMDGKGYPHGIMGNRLCHLARIVAVADCFDAMTSHRPYRLAKPMDRVREEFKRVAGKHLDSEMVGTLLHMDMEALRKELDAQD